MKKIERIFVEEPTSYAPPKMRMIRISNSASLCVQSPGSGINDAGEDYDDIFTVDGE